MGILCRGSINTHNTQAQTTMSIDLSKYVSFAEFELETASILAIAITIAIALKRYQKKEEINYTSLKFFLNHS